MGAAAGPAITAFRFILHTTLVIHPIKTPITIQEAGSSFTVGPRIFEKEMV